MQISFVRPKFSVLEKKKIDCKYIKHKFFNPQQFGVKFAIVKSYKLCVFGMWASKPSPWLSGRLKRPGLIGLSIRVRTTERFFLNMSLSKLVTLKLRQENFEYINTDIYI